TGWGSCLSSPCTRCSVKRLLGFHPLQRGVVGQVQLQWRERDPSLLHRPAVGARVALLDRPDGEPEVLSSHRVLSRYHIAVVLADRLAGPHQALGLAGESDIPPTEARELEQKA